MTITFTCEDKLIAEFYDKMFRSLFEEHLAWTPVKALPELMQFMREVMLAEARFQEHYDYITDERGVRRPIYDKDGQPKLLIPEVFI